jgi:hypothetical protein
MPKLHQRDDGEFYIFHNIGGMDDEGPGMRRFGVSAEAAELFEQRGYREGSSLPHDFFHELLEEDLIWPGQVPQFAPSDVGAQVALTAEVTNYFKGLEQGSVTSGHAIETFRVDLLSKARRIRDAVLKKEMFIHIAQKLAEVQTTSGDALRGSLHEMKSMLLLRTPPQWEQMVRAILGPDFTPSTVESRVSADDSSELTQDRVEAKGGSERRRGDLDGFDSLSPEQREWVISCCSKFPGVTVEQNIDPATGEIHMVFAGLPVDMPQRLVDLVSRRH